MGRKAQASLELALFLGLMLIVLLAALSYQRNLREQKLTDINVFKEVKRLAHDNQFIRKDIDGMEIVGSGAVVSYSLNVDRQANRIFQGGQRRTAASSASVYDSNDEDPPNLEYSYYNTAAKDISAGIDEYKIYASRPGGKVDPEDGMKLSTAQWISMAYPVLILAAKGFFKLMGWNWSSTWGSWLNVVGRAIILAQLIKALADLKTSSAEALRTAALKAQDEQMGEWGWRICDESHDPKWRAGKYYVKVVTPQVWDVETVEPKTIDYTETQTADTSTRNVAVGHTVTYKVYRRYDTTGKDSQNPLLDADPTVPLAQHAWETLAPKEVTIDLSGGQSETWN